LASPESSGNKKFAKGRILEGNLAEQRLLVLPKPSFGNYNKTELTKGE